MASAAAAATSNNNNNGSSSNILDLEASPIPGQTGWAVLDLQGTVLRQSQLFQDQDCKLLFQMLQESATIVVKKQKASANDKEDGRLRRLTVTFAESRFVVTRDEYHVYLVQTRV